MQKLSIATGDFLFKHRNWVFPVFITCIFAIGIPPSETFGSEFIEHIKDGFAIFTAMMGLALRGLVIGQRYVKRSGVAKNIQADELFTTGMFSLCRNPLYTGNVLILCGIFLMHGNPYAILVGTACFTLIYRAIIAAEENYLLRTFGDDYAEYCRHVPRWIPNVLRLRQVMRRQPFRLSRVLIVEYTNIGLTVGALALVEFYEEIEEPLTQARWGYMAFLVATFSVALLWIATMRLLKKRQILATS